MTNIIALKDRIKSTGMSVTFVAREAGIVRETLYNRMRSRDFRLSEISALSRVLGLSKEERDAIFLPTTVNIIQQKEVRRMGDQLKSIQVDSEKKNATR